MGKVYSSCYQGKRKKLKKANQRQDSEYFSHGTEPQNLAPNINTNRSRQEIKLEIEGHQDNVPNLTEEAKDQHDTQIKKEPNEVENVNYRHEENEEDELFHLGAEFEIPKNESMIYGQDFHSEDVEKFDWQTNSIIALTKELNGRPVATDHQQIQTSPFSPESKLRNSSLHQQYENDGAKNKNSTSVKDDIQPEKELNKSFMNSKQEQVVEAAPIPDIVESNKNNMRLEFSNVLLESQDVARSIKPSTSQITGTRPESTRRNLDMRKRTSVQNPKEPVLVVLEKPRPNEIMTIQGNYDVILNNNLVANNNMILDDSILEAQGVTSVGKFIVMESSKLDKHIFQQWNKREFEDIKYYHPLKNIWTDQGFCYDDKVMHQIYAQEIVLERISNRENAVIIEKSSTNRFCVSQGKVWTNSLVSVLVVIKEYEKRKKGFFTENMIYPQLDLKHIVNVYGKYGVKIQFNGANRLIEIDDRIAFESHGTLLGAHTGNKNEFWVSLIEKAICKLYSAETMIIPSVPSIECYHITGWTPEIIKVSEISNVNHLWQRLMQNYKENNILIIFGTKSCEQSLDMDTLDYQQGCYKDPMTDLVLDHNYSVLGLAEIDKLKCIIIKNPWGHTHAKLLNIEDYGDDFKVKIQKHFEMPEFELNTNGLSVVLWEDIIPMCSDIYLNWNPRVYPFHQKIHSRRIFDSNIYNSSSKLWNEDYSLEYFPQFLFKIPPHDEDFEVRVFFQRHVNSLNQDKFHSLSYRLFSYSGDRVILPNDALRSHAWNPRELLTDVFIFEASKEVEIYVLVLLSQPLQENNKYEIENQTFNFTFETFSFIEVDVIEVPFRKLKHREIINGIFDENSIGGNVLSPVFLQNPKYVITVKEANDFHFKVEGPDESSLMLILVPTDGLDLSRFPIGQLPFQNFVTNNPGFYFQGFSSYKLRLDPGTYVLMISNQNYERGSYTLYIDVLSEEVNHQKLDFEEPQNASCPFSIQEYEELSISYQIELEGKWTEENSKGMSWLPKSEEQETQEYHYFMKNPGYVFKPTVPTKIQFVLQSSSYANQYYDALENDFERTNTLEPPLLNIAVFEILGNLNFKPIVKDDSYVPAAWGYYSREVLLKPNELGYLVICLNAEKGYTGTFKLTLLSDNLIDNLSDSSNIIKLGYPYNVKGSWAKENSGGCMSEMTFYKNPSYEITAYSDCLLFIELSSPEPHPLCISFFESDGKGITQLDAEVLNKVITNKYLTQEMTFLRTTLRKNSTYLLIPSTRYSTQHGKFELKMESTEKIDVYKKKLVICTDSSTFVGEWNFETNLGPLGSPRFIENPSMLIRILKSTFVRVRLYSAVENSYSIAIHLYEVHGQTELVFMRDSGSYTNIRMGCFIEEQMEPNQHGYLLIFSNFEIDKYGEFSVEVESVEPNAIQVEKLFRFGEASASS